MNQNQLNKYLKKLKYDGDVNDFGLISKFLKNKDIKLICDQYDRKYHTIPLSSGVY